MNDEIDSPNPSLDWSCADDAAGTVDGATCVVGRSDSYPAFRLRSVVVEYEGRPNRRTVSPEGLSSLERMSTWLTADDAAFVSLEDAR